MFQRPVWTHHKTEPLPSSVPWFGQDVNCRWLRVGRSIGRMRCNQSFCCLGCWQWCWIWSRWGQSGGGATGGKSCWNLPSTSGCKLSGRIQGWCWGEHQPLWWHALGRWLEGSDRKPGIKRVKFIWEGGCCVDSLLYESWVFGGKLGHHLICDQQWTG